MVLATLAALLLFAEAAPAPAPTATPAPAAVEPVTAQINTILETWRGKAGDGLRGRLGLSQTTKTASDGEAIFWIRRAEEMGCGIDATGQMRCGTGGAGECALAIGFDNDGKVKTWRVTGAPPACQKFVDDLTVD